MKIILSPTKTMNLTNEYYQEFTKPNYVQESKEIRNIIKTYKLNEIKSIFKVSDNLAQKVFEYYHEDSIKKSALSMYQGQAFKAMQIDLWTEAELDYAKDKIIILSALYGALRPSDKISPYRLDFFTNIELDLYDYWQSKLVLDEDLYINLASKEFSSLLPEEKLLNIHFIEADHRVKATYAKTARGNMTKQIIKQRISSLEDLKKINVNGYIFDHKLSDTNNYYYKKSQA